MKKKSKIKLEYLPQLKQKIKDSLCESFSWAVDVFALCVNLMSRHFLGEIIRVISLSGNVVQKGVGPRRHSWVQEAPVQEIGRQL